MAIHLYDTMTRAKQPLVPADPARVTLYVCGPTVYNRSHIGNARPAVVFDLLARLLRYDYGAGSVVYARNVTDIDDKIIASAAAEGVPIDTITARFERHYLEDMAALGVLPPDLAPHATAHVPGMVAMIAGLIERGHAYAADGHVLFDVTSYADYGRLSRRPLDEMIAGARVEMAPYKRAPADFVLWKPSEPGQPGWDSPWGRGRPGWHIECSAMIASELGQTIDIHGGGLDLQFPHHENEAAQSACAHAGASLARIWMHNGFLSMGEEKMSKSLGNVVLVSELLETRLDRAHAAPRSPQRPLPPAAGLDRHAARAEQGPPRPPPAPRRRRRDGERPVGGRGSTRARRSQHPEALAQLATLRDAPQVRATAALLGIERAETIYMSGASQIQLRSAMSASTTSLTGEEIDRLVSERTDGRRRRDFARSDEIREALAAAGVLLEDTPDGPKWRLE